MAVETRPVAVRRDARRPKAEAGEKTLAVLAGVELYSLDLRIVGAEVLEPPPQQQGAYPLAVPRPVDHAPAESGGVTLQAVTLQAVTSQKNAAATDEPLRAPVLNDEVVRVGFGVQKFGELGLFGRCKNPGQVAPKKVQARLPVGPFVNAQGGVHTRSVAKPRYLRRGGVGRILGPL